MGLRCYRRAALRHVIAAVLCFAVATALRGQSVSLEGERVVEIRVVDEYGRPVEGHLPALRLQEGQPFELEAERHSLRALYRSGDFADIRVEAAHVAGGVRVDFVVRRNFYYNTVRIEGLREPPSEAQALSALRLGLGEPFRDSTVHDALNRLTDLLQEEGFYQANVDYSLGPNAETRQMNITVHVMLGARARISTIQMQNQSEFPNPELLHRSKLSSGKEITRFRLERAADRVRKFLVSNGHLGARVLIRRGDFEPKTNTQPLVFEITAGPKVHVEIEGAKIPGKQLRKLLPIYAEGAVDEDLLQEGRRNLRDDLQRQGYFDAQVQYSTREDKERGEEVIVYSIDRGDRHRLVGIGFVGNKYFNNELLESRLSIQTAAFASRGRFSEQLLRNDVGSIRDLYLANGFRDAQVQSEVDDNYSRKQGDLFVRFHITEGAQTRVAELKLEGNHALSDEELLEVVGSTPGQPYSEFDVTGDRDNILALYYNEGFPEARFDSQVTDTGVPNRVRLTYRITEGPQIEVAQVLVSGYQHTRLGVIERQIQLKADGPLREGDVVETQRRLYNLGVFNRVQIAPQNPAGADPDKDVVVEVDEAKRYTIGYGGGFEVQRLGGAGASPVGGTLNASPRGIFEISKANFGGRAQTVSFKVRASTLQYRSLLSFAAPNVFNKPQFNLLLTGFADKTRDVRTFTSTRYEASAQLAENLTPFSSLIYRYTFRHVLAGDLKISPQEIPLFSQPTRISGPGISWLRDHRDNPGDASRGSFNSADSSVAARSLGSSDSFARFFFQNSTFHPIKRSFVFARSVRFGVEKPIAGTTSQEIPLPERFFAGGGTSLRGFGLNQAGPRDPGTGFPIGGRAELIFNQEIRFPMRLPYIGNRLGGAVFYDAGNVFSDVGHITLRTSPSAVSMHTGDLNYFSHTIGYSFRYGTPIGPVRLDLGYQLNPAKFMFTSPNPGCVTPSPPPSCHLTAQLPHFQFFFNIGAIF